MPISTAEGSASVFAFIALTMLFEIIVIIYRLREKLLIIRRDGRFPWILSKCVDYASYTLWIWIASGGSEFLRYHCLQANIEPGPGGAGALSDTVVHLELA